MWLSHTMLKVLEISRKFPSSFIAITSHLNSSSFQGTSWRFRAKLPQYNKLPSFSYTCFQSLLISILWSSWLWLCYKCSVVTSEYSTSLTEFFDSLKRHSSWKTNKRKSSLSSDKLKLFLLQVLKFLRIKVYQHVRDLLVTLKTSSTNLQHILLLWNLMMMWMMMKTTLRKMIHCILISKILTFSPPTLQSNHVKIHLKIRGKILRDPIQPSLLTPHLRWHFSQKTIRWKNLWLKRSRINKMIPETNICTHFCHGKFQITETI